MADPLTQIPNIRKRQDGKLATTTFVNEVADAVRGISVLPTTGTPPTGGQFLGGSPVKVTGNRSGGGQYDIIVGEWAYDLTNPSALSLAELTEFELSKIPGVLINQGENSKSTHYVSSDAIIEAWPAGIQTSDGLPVYVVNYTHAIRDIRYNATTNILQVTYNDADTVPESDWVNKISFVACPSTSVAEFFSF